MGFIGRTESSNVRPLVGITLCKLWLSPRHEFVSCSGEDATIICSLARLVPNEVVMFLSLVSRVVRLGRAALR